MGRAQNPGRSARAAPGVGACGLPRATTSLSSACFPPGHEKTADIMILTIEQEWEQFIGIIHPGVTLHPIQREEMRRTWFSAWGRCFRVIVEVSNGETEAE